MNTMTMMREQHNRIEIPQRLEFVKYETSVCSESREDQSGKKGKGSRQSCRTKRRKNPKETQTGKWMSPGDQANLARRKVKRRVSLVSVSHHACLETQKFFDAKNKNILFELSDMEKPTIKTPGCEDLMSLPELAGLISMQLTNVINGGRGHRTTKSSPPVLV
jgi:hypothetical protein